MDDEASELEALERIMIDASAEPMKLSYGLMRSITDNFSNEIGRGGFGVVYRGALQNGDVAVKKLLNLHALPEKQFLDEITCLKKAKHKNIVKFLGYCSEAQGELLEFNGANVMGEIQQKLLCFQYVPNGNITHYLQQDKSQGDDWPLRYKMIRGICQGLHYLHGIHISHLDLKPDNVMLDADMEPKITDFGLSRCLDKGQSKIITQNILGTLRYIAPETINSGEISFHSDMYALGIIIIELLAGTDKTDLDNWDELLDEMDCPRVRRCTEIARNCTDRKKHNRPTILEVIRDLDELESTVPWSLINEVIPTAFPGTELLDVFPLELRFPFVPNQEMRCHLSVTNKTDGGVYCAIIPGVPDRYRGGFKGYLPPRFTAAITLHREAEEELPSYTDKLEILMLLVGSDKDVFEQQIQSLSLEEETSCEDTLKAAHELLGFDLHRTMLTTIVVVSEDDDPAVVADTTGQEREDGIFVISSIDVHQTEPWILFVNNGGVVNIWNWQTNEKMGEYESPKVPNFYEMISDSLVAQFISRKQWVVTGNSLGSIIVHTCPKMDMVKEFRAHHHGVTSLAVHQTRSLLLSCSKSKLLKIWDWNRGWSCTKVFDNNIDVKQVMFNPKHTNTFATLTENRDVQMWRIDHPDPIATTQRLTHFGSGYYFIYMGGQHFIATLNHEYICVWDLQKEKHLHTLCTKVSEEHMFQKVTTEYVWEHFIFAVCHPTREVFVTVSSDLRIHVWDSTTYRLKKVYENLPLTDLYVGFTGSRRLVIVGKERIIVMDIDPE